MNTIKNMPKDERPYEKCLKYGTSAMTDIDLLSVILRTGTKGSNVKDLATNLLKSKDGYSGLLCLMHYSYEDLLSFNGIGSIKAVQILCIAELAKRISITSSSNTMKFNNPALVSDYYMEKLRHLDKEHLYVMYLDTKCKLIKDKLVSQGTINQSLVSPRDILVEALKCNSVNMILIHNHPSGDSTPSRDDIKSTLKVKAAADIVGIKMLDHVIIGDKTHTSLKDLKLI